MTVTTEGYEKGYKDGESSAAADYVLALDAILPDGVSFTGPADLAVKLEAMLPKWLPISEAPVTDNPLIVWLPIRAAAVSAVADLIYAEDGNTPVAIDPDGHWSMTDRTGGHYGLPLDEQPTHYLSGLKGP